MSIKRDTVLNLTGIGIPLIAAAYTIPYLLEKLGNESFGLLTLIWALIGYFGLFDLGVGRAMTYEISRAVGSGNFTMVTKLIKAGLLLTIFTGMIGALIVFSFVFFGTNLFKIGLNHQQETRLAFAIISLAIVPTTLTSGIRGAMEGFGKFGQSNKTKIILGTLMFLIPALCVIFGYTELQFIAWNLVGVRFVVMFYAIFQLRENLFNKISIVISDMKPFLNYGSWLTISGIISPLMVYGDRFLVSLILGASALPVYAITQEGMGRLLLFPTALTGALMPRLAQGKDVVFLKSVYSSHLKQIAWVMLGVCTVADILAYPVLKHWISPKFADEAIWIVIILSFGVWANSLAQLPLTLLHARGKPKIASILHIFELVIYSGVIILLLRWLGIIGAAIAWTIRVNLDLILLHCISLKYLKTLESEAMK